MLIVYANNQSGSLLLQIIFRNTSEELRTLRVSKMAKEIAKDWDEQIRMKYRLECEQEENDRLYDYLWLKDAENKVISCHKSRVSLG